MENLKLTYAHNTRDLGNMPTVDGRVIKENMLIRSGKLNKLTQEDIELLKEHNLKVVVDFRDEEEFVKIPDVKIDGVTYLNFPAIEDRLKSDTSKPKKEDSNLLKLVDKDIGGKTLIINTYKDLFLNQKGITAYQNFFKTIMEADGAILWHCSQGKDRAGMAAFLVEYALGVPIDICMDDYYYTNVAMEETIERLTKIVLKESNNDYSLIPILREVFLAKEEYITATLTVIYQTYGSLENFIENVLHVDVEKLKAKFLI